MDRTLNNNDEVDATQPVLYSDREPVTVAEYPDPAAAHMARMALDDANIPVFLQGENANNMLPVAFGARVMVHPEDEAAARKVLTDFDAQPVSFAEVTAAEKAAENASGVYEDSIEALKRP